MERSDISFNDATRYDDSDCIGKVWNMVENARGTCKIFLSWKYAETFLAEEDIF